MEENNCNRLRETKLSLSLCKGNNNTSLWDTIRWASAGNSWPSLILLLIVVNKDVRYDIWPRKRKGEGGGPGKVSIGDVELYPFWWDFVGNHNMRPQSVHEGVQLTHKDNKITGRFILTPAVLS